jgi:Flp pilus assembly protein TadG
MIRFLQKLRKDCAGSAIMEFAILAPAAIVMMLGVLQIGMWMQGYNAIRGVAADTSRYVTVEYQKGNRISNIAMASWAHTRAMSSAYRFRSANVSTSVVDDATQTIIGVTKKTLTVTYRMNSILGMVNVGNLNLTFTRPIFVKST